MTKNNNTSSPISEKSSDSNKEPRLFGIMQSNREHADMWGKNCFNSAFPTSLACYMRSHDIDPVYVCLEAKDDKSLCVNREISVDDIFNVSSDICNEDLYFSFETKFDPYLKYVSGETQLDGADVVVRHGDRWCRALQVKLTVVPDSTTSDKNKDEWGPELVFRPADTCSCALGIFAGVADHAEEVAEIFRVPCAGIQDWNNMVEMKHIKADLLNCVEKFLTTFHKKQKPYLLQQIWLTKGKSPLLAEKSFDLFVWSDYALIFSYLEKANNEKDLDRSMRAVARFARIQYELATSSPHQIDIRKINREMTFLLQTDKEVAISGLNSRLYMTSSRRTNPSLPSSVLKEIILNNGHKKLSPERRLDQTIYFTAKQYFEE